MSLASPILGGKYLWSGLGKGEGTDRDADKVWEKTNLRLRHYSRYFIFYLDGYGGFPTGWLYDLTVGTGTEQGQWPDKSVAVARQKCGSGEVAGRNRNIFKGREAGHCDGGIRSSFARYCA